MPDYMHVPCSNCHRELRVRKKYAGIEVTCSYCGADFVVPKAEEPPAPPHEAAILSQPEREAYEDQITRLTAELREARTELERIAAQYSQASQDLRALKEEVHRLQSEHDRLSDENSSLRSQADQMQSGDAARLAELASLRAKYGELEQAHAAEVGGLESVVSQLRQESEQARRDWEVQRSGSKNETSALEEKLKQRDLHHSEKIREFELRVQELEQRRQQEVVLLNESLETSQRRNAELIEEIRGLETKLAAPMAATAPHSSREVEELTQQLQQAEKTIAELNSLIRGLGITVT